MKDQRNAKKVEETARKEEEKELVQKAKRTESKRLYRQRKKEANDTSLAAAANHSSIISAHPSSVTNHSDANVLQVAPTHGGLRDLDFSGFKGTIAIGGTVNAGPVNNSGTFNYGEQTYNNTTTQNNNNDHSSADAIIKALKGGVDDLKKSIGG